jgi:hypothetical protein
VGYPLSFEKFVDNDRIRYAAKVKKRGMAEKIIEQIKESDHTAILCLQSEHKRSFYGFGAQRNFYSIEITNDAMEHFNCLESLKREQANNNLLVQLRGWIDKVLVDPVLNTALGQSRSR